MFFLNNFLNVFRCFFNVVFFVVVKAKTYKITNMMHFSWAKTPFLGQSECFVVTLFDSYWRCFLLEWILQFNVLLFMFLMIFNKSFSKNMFLMFFICKLMFLTSMEITGQFSGLRNRHMFTCCLFKGDSLSYSVGARFSTKDRDKTALKCAETMEKGGWWYKDCGKCNPNGVYFSDLEYDRSGIHWQTWRSEYYSLASIEMKVREYGVDLDVSP